MAAILMMSAKLATLDLLKIKVSWNKSNDAIISAYDVNNKILSRDSNHIVDVVMWLKFGISMRELIITSISFDQKNFFFFEGSSWFKFNNLWLALGASLKLYPSVAKVLKLRVRKFWGLIVLLDLSGPQPHFKALGCWTPSLIFYSHL